MKFFFSALMRLLAKVDFLDIYPHKQPTNGSDLINDLVFDKDIYVNGTTGIFIDSIWIKNSNINRFQLNGVDHKPHNEEIFLKQKGRLNLDNNGSFFKFVYY